MDARRFRSKSKGRRVSPDHRAEPAHPAVTGWHRVVQPATDADVSVRHGPQ